MTDPIVTPLARALHGAGPWPDYPHWADPARKTAKRLLPAITGEGLVLVSAKQLAALQKLVALQAEDEGPWFIARTAPETYLQQELRRLHAAIEHHPFDLAAHQKRMAREWLTKERPAQITPGVRIIYPSS